MTLATTWKVQWGASVGGREREGASWLGCLRPLDSAQCEWERLTWPFFAVSASPYSQGVLLLGGFALRV